MCIRDRPNPISIYERVDGKWQEYKLNSKSHKYDGYSVNKCSDGTYEFSFVIDMGKTGLNTREFTAVGK